MKAVLGGKNRDRYISPAPLGEPFYSFGNTWRGEYELKARGWYIVINGSLYGPALSKADILLELP